MFNNIVERFLTFTTIVRVGKDAIKSPLFAGSMVMIIGTNLANFFGYIYHLIFGRLMGPSLYGDLVVILSIVGFVSALFSFIGTVIVKFVSSNKEKVVKQIHTWILKRVLLIGTVSLLLSFLFKDSLSAYLKIEDTAVYTLGLIIFFSLLSFIYSSFLQGLLMFKQSVFINNLTWIIKIGLGTLLYLVGLSLFGVMFAIFISLIIATFLYWHFLRKKIGKEDGKEKFKINKEIWKYSLPVFVMTMAASSFVTVDVLLVKHFFQPREIGIYASLSTLGKIIFYAVSPIVSVMFPLASKRHSETGKSGDILKLSLLLSSLIIFGILGIYSLIPQHVVKLLYGELYLEAIPYLFYFGVFSALFAFNMVIISYYFSIGKTFTGSLILIFALLQILGIFFFHQSIKSVIIVSIVTSLLLLFSLVIYGYFTKNGSAGKNEISFKSS